MKRMVGTLLALLVTLSAHGEINFLRGALSEAVKRSETEKKPVMIDFITDWCRWCDTLDARTYSDPGVSSYVSEHVIPIKIDAEKGEGIEIAKKYGVSAYPTIIFIRSDGEEIDRILGYVPAEPFLKTVTDYVNGRNTLTALLADLGSKPDDPALRYALATKYTERNNSHAALEHFKKLIELDPTNTHGHMEEAEYNVGVATFKDTKDPRPLEAFTAKYPNSEMVRSALHTLWRSYVKSKDGDNARKYFTRYIEKNPTDAGMMNDYAWTCAGNNVNLDHAAQMVKQAIELTKNESDRASFIDTYATVEFARGNTDQAIALEQQALDILKNIPGAKLADYEKSMDKFKAGKKERGTQ